MGKSKKQKSTGEKPILQKKEFQITDLYLRIITIGIYLALLTPLVVIHSHVYPFLFGKVVLFRSIVEFISIPYLALILAEHRYSPRWGLIELTVTLFLAVYILTSFTGIDPTLSFWGTLERMDGVFSFIHYWIFFMIAGTVFQTQEDWKKVFFVSMTIATAVSIHAAVVQYNQGIRGGALGNEGFLAYYLMIHVFFGIYFFSLLKDKFFKFICLVAIILFICVLFISGTRSALFALSVGLVALYSFYLALSANKRIRVFIFSAMIIAIFLAFSAVGILHINKDSSWVKNHRTLTRLSSMSLEEGTMKDRLTVWSSAWEGFKDKPLLGWGPESFNIAYNKYYNPQLFLRFGSGSVYDRAHNVFLDILVMMGVMGFCSYAAIFIALYYLTLRNLNRAREDLMPFAMIFAIPAAYIAKSLFWFDDPSSQIMFFLFLAFSTSTLSNRSASIVATQQKSNDCPISTFNFLDFKILRTLTIKYMPYCLAVWIIIVGVVMYYGNIKPWVFNRSLKMMTRAFNLDKDDSFDRYRTAKSRMSYPGRIDLYKWLGDYVNDKYKFRDFRDANSKDQLRVNMNYAIEELTEASNKYPYDYEVYLILGRLYNSCFIFFPDPFYPDKGEKILRKALELSPKRITILYELGQALIFKKQHTKAIEVFRRAVELNPSVAVSYYYLGMAYTNAGKQSEAEQMLDKAIALGYDYRKPR